MNAMLEITVARARDDENDPLDAKRNPRFALLRSWALAERYEGGRGFFAPPPQFRLEEMHRHTRPRQLAIGVVRRVDEPLSMSAVKKKDGGRR